MTGKQAGAFGLLSMLWGTECLALRLASPWRATVLARVPQGLSGSQSLGAHTQSTRGTSVVLHAARVAASSLGVGCGAGPLCHHRGVLFGEPLGGLVGFIRNVLGRCASSVARNALRIGWDRSRLDRS